MKSQVKEGYRKKQEKQYEHILPKFGRLVQQLCIWKHYIILYYKEREVRFYDTLYRDKPLSRLSHFSNGHPDSFSARLEEESPFGTRQLDQDDFGKINVGFFIEEFFYTLLEVLHTCGALAFT